MELTLRLSILYGLYGPFKTLREWSGIKVKVKAVCGSYSTATLRHIVLLPE